MGDENSVGNDFDLMFPEGFDKGFTWLIDNPRACNWLYVGGVVSGLESNGAGGMRRVVDGLGMSKHGSYAEKLPRAVAVAEAKLGQMNTTHATHESIKATYQTSVDTWVKPRWLNEDDEGAAAYFLKKLNHELGEAALAAVSVIEGSSKEDLHFLCLAKMDLWDVSPEAKALFLKKASASWSQKKHRDSRKGKKAINCYIDEKSRKRLDLLAKAKRRNISEMLGDIIDDAFNAYKSERKR